ncbi:MAG TPA: NAD-dependent epimerase/dehydratase family protein [Polyangiaceae bacterium]
MKLLVTGGAGFIGSHIVEHALSDGHEVAVLDDLSTGRRENVPAGVALFEVDLRNREATERVIKDFKPTVVSHQAAQASVSISVRDPAFDVTVNVIGSINLFDACATSGVELLIFASTGGAIYGEVPEPARARENDALLPYSPYAISKLTVEKLLHFYKGERGLNYRVLRYANIYGPRQDAHGEAGVVAIFAERMLKGDPIQVNARRQLGDAGCVRDYTYVSDVARANLAAAAGRVEQLVTNVGTGVSVSTSELAGMMQRTLGIEATIKQGPHRAGDLERSVLDPSRCTQLLGPPTSMAVGLATTLEWYRAHRSS